MFRTFQSNGKGDIKNPSMWEILCKKLMAAISKFGELFL